MDIFNLVRNTPTWYQIWFWVTCVSAVLLVFFRFTVLQGRDPSGRTDSMDRAQQAINIQGGSIGGDVVLGNKSAASQGQEAGLLRQRQTVVKIRRLLEDFLDYLRAVLEQHRKDIDQIAQQHVFRGTYSSGPHLREQYELSRKRRKEISRKWLEVKRGIEDEFLESGQTGLVDETLKQQYGAAEQAREQAQGEILDLTHSYFASRGATFSVPDLEKLKQAILNDESI